MPDELVSRLDCLWTKTGREWSWDEAVAALYFRDKRLEHPFNISSRAQLFEIALLTGRAVKEVEESLLQFNRLDPTVTDSASNYTDDSRVGVWESFFDYDSNTIRSDALTQEFERLWPSVRPSGASAKALSSAFDAEAKRLSRKGLGELRHSYRMLSASAFSKPAARSAWQRVFDRSPLVVAIAKLRAKYRCEVPECTEAGFRTVDGTPYCEVHHIIPLGEGGEDTIENVACVCPSHHREAHHGERADNLRAALQDLRCHDESAPNGA